METIQILIFGILWIISGLFTAFLMIFSDIKLKELGIVQNEKWILGKGGTSAVLLLVAIGPISLFLGILVFISFIYYFKKK